MKSVSLVGLGNIGIGYDIRDELFISGQTMTHAKALLESQDFELIHFTDAAKEKLFFALKVIQKAGINTNRNVFCNSISDVIVIAVNTAQHASVVLSILKPPEILVLEKPAGSNSIECSRISSWGFENNVKIFVNYFRRYLTSSVNARLYFNKLQAGKFLSAEINAYGTVLNIYSHFIDLGNFITGQQIFCGCTNKLRSNLEGLLEATCESCNVSYRLSGIGRLKLGVSMTLEFENVSVRIEHDGCFINITDKVNQVSIAFECEVTEYKNYQKIVYEKIGAMLRLNKFEEGYVGLAEANMVHQFIESVELNHE